MRDSAGDEELFEDTQQAGTWGGPVEIPGLPTATSSTTSVSFYEWRQLLCTDVNQCIGIAYFYDSDTGLMPVLVTDDNGVWSGTTSPPGYSTLSGLYQLDTISCWSTSNCTISGITSLSSGFSVFANTETAGVWGTAQVVPGPGNLSTATGSNHGAELTSIACSSSTECAGVGYVDLSGNQSEPIVISEHHGVWGKAKLPPGWSTAAHAVARNAYGDVEISALSCATATQCSAETTFPLAPPQVNNYILSETNGVWSHLVAIPALPVSVKGKVRKESLYGVEGLSCTTALGCVTVGVLEKVTLTKVGKNAYNFTYTFSIASSQSTGTSYSTPASITAPVSTDGSSPYQISAFACGSGGSCVIGGSLETSTDIEPFVITST
jgi:hypothetical protein